MSRERGFGRRIWRWVAIVVALPLAVAAVGLGLIYTETGSRWLVNRARAWLPEALAFESFEGTIAGPFEVRGLEYASAGLHGRIERARVHWQPWKLMSRVVQLDSLRVTGVWAKRDSTQRTPEMEAAPAAEGRDSTRWQVRCDRLAISGAVVEVPHGLKLHDIELSAGGGPDSFQVSLAGHATYDTLSGLSLALTGTGDLKHFAVDELTLTRDSTRLAAQGHVEWQPELSWDVTAEIDRLNPALWSVYLSRLSGSVRMTGSSRGRLAAEQPEYSLIVDTLSGVLQGAPISGHASLQVLGNVVQIDSTWIDWRGFSANVRGQYADSVNLAWDASVPDLSLILDRCAGSLRAQGEAHGPRDSLEVSAGFSGQDLAFREYAALDVAGEVAWRGGGARRSRLTARLQHVLLPNWILDSISVEADGTRSSHAGRLVANGPRGRLSAVVEGCFDSLWRASIDSLEVISNVVGTWRLAQRAEITAGSDRSSVRGFCLAGDRGRVCAEAEMRSGEDWRLSAELDSLASDWLSRLASPDVVFDARVSGHLEASSTSKSGMAGSAQLSATPGLLTLNALPEDTISSDSLTMALEWTSEAGQLQAGGGFTLRGDHTPFALDCTLPGTGRLQAELASDTAHWEQLPWSVRLEVDPLALGWLDPLLPEDTRLDGQASLRIEAVSESGGRIRGDCSLRLPPGHMLVWTGADTLLLEWAASVFELRADSTGVVARASSALSASGRSVGTMELDVHSPRPLAWGQNPLDLPVQGTAGARLELSPLEPFVHGVTGLQGEFRVSTTITGTPRDLALEGNLELTAEAFLQDLGIQLSNVRLSMRAAGGQATVTGSATSGQGTLELTGTLNRLPSRESPSRMRVRGSKFLALESRQASVWLSPDLELAMFGDSLDLSGSIDVPQARIEIVKLPEQAVAGSRDEVILGDTLAARGPRSPFWSRVQLKLGDQVFFKGFDVTAFLGGAIEVRQKPGADAEGRGEVVLREGRYRGMGQDLQIDPGRLIFSGPLFDPTLDVIAYRRAADNVRAGFKVSGRVTSPQVDLYSDPMKPEHDIMSYILFGRSSGEGSDSERLKASEAAALMGGNLLAAQAATQIGLDEARIDPGYTGTDAALVAGKYISPQLFVGYGTGLFESLHTLRVRYIVSTHISLQAETGTRETADVIYQIERGE